MKSAAKPFVSVCIPVFNCEAYIGEAIESVLAQTYKDHELVIIDDRSTDRTLEVVRKYSDPRIRLIRNEKNLGHKGNWNKALEEASGKYVKILPHDDMIYPQCLEKQVAVFETRMTDGLALVSCARNIINRNGVRLMKRSFGKHEGYLNGREAIRKSIRAGTNLIGEPGAVLMRNDLAKEIGSFDDIDFYCIDLDYWCRMLLHGGIHIIPEPLAAFRVAAGSASLRIASSQSRDFKSLIARLRRDARYGLTPNDCRAGKLKASINQWLRRLFYLRLHVRRRELMLA
jgi:glycosyltransferase involved in cell wall biosynthesis